MSLIWQFRYTNYVIWIAYYITVITPTNLGLLKDTFFYIDSFLYDNVEHFSGTDYYDDCTVIYQMKDEKISSFSSILIIIDKLVRSSKWQLTLTHIRYTYTMQGWNKLAAPAAMLTASNSLMCFLTDRIWYFESFPFVS